ncbi:MLO-like protein 12 [Tanacetum coccineum]
MDDDGKKDYRKDERSLTVTPSWAVAVVVFVILFISILLEYALHLIGHWLHKKHKKSLQEALEKIKAGFISLLLTVGKESIANICIPSKVARTWHPCKKNYPDNSFYDTCLKKGKVQMVSNYGIHQLHIFIFVLAVVHVAYCILTLALGLLKGCFFRQFFNSVPKVDYLTLRHGFINTHLTPEQEFDFHKYISRSLEEDFKSVVGISPIVWFFAVLLLLTYTHDWYAYLWLPFIPLIILLIVGTKLQVIITKMGRRTHEMADVIKGTPTVQPGDDLFWFGRPRLNAFQLAFFLWSWYEFGFKSCYHHRDEDIIIRITMGAVIQFLCSYVTLPLYALVTQMGSRMKPTIFSDNVSKALKTWRHTAKDHVKHGTHSPFSSRPGTPLHGSTSPMHLLHRHPDDSLDSPSNSPRGSGFEHEGWANEIQEHENLSRDEVPELREIEIQEPSSSSTKFPSGSKPVRTQREEEISNFSFGKK